MSEKTGLNNVPDLPGKIQRLMELLSLAKDNGELQIFSALFMTDFQIIAYLASHENTHPSELADTLRSTRPNIAANLRTLESKGYIVRNIDENNHRQVYVNITEKGKIYFQICQKQLGYLFSSWFALLGEEEVEHLFVILEKSCRPDIMTDELKKFNFGD
ncbi:MAG: MarR family winged helix-turn-helix transcriptional regulator [Bacilli bacterium]